jgi:hypothetical protein
MVAIGITTTYAVDYLVDADLIVGSFAEIASALDATRPPSQSDGQGCSARGGAS